MDIPIEWEIHDITEDEMTDEQRRSSEIIKQVFADGLRREDD